MRGISFFLLVSFLSAVPVSAQDVEDEVCTRMAKQAVQEYHKVLAIPGCLALVGGAEMPTWSDSERDHKYYCLRQGYMFARYAHETRLGAIKWCHDRGL